MKNIKLLLLAVVATFSLNSCTDEVEAPGTPFATFESSSVDVGVLEGSETTKDIKIYTANISGSERTIEISVIADETTADPAAYTVAPSVTIPAGSNEGVLTFGLKDLGLDEDKKVVLQIQETAEIYAGEKITVNVSQACPDGQSKVKLNIEFDRWPEEAQWAVFDADTGNLLDYALYGSYSGATAPFDKKWCLDAGNYLFRAYDQYGDGGNNFTLNINGANAFTTGSGNWGSRSDFTFTLQ